MLGFIAKLLFTLSVIFTLILVALPLSPRYLSFQDPLDAENLFSEYRPEANTAIFNNTRFSISQDNTPQVLGESTIDSTNINKRIEVDLTNQMLYAFEDNKLVYSFLISSGKWDRTPNGTFKIWTKIRSQKMSGGSKELGTYYYLPNVPYILFFYNDNVAKNVGYSIHGTYWHNNFGVPMSHGCINMVTADVAKIYNWAQVGTQINIYGKYQTKLPSAQINLRSALHLL